MAQQQQQQYEQYGQQQQQGHPVYQAPHQHHSANELYEMYDEYATGSHPNSNHYRSVLHPDSLFSWFFKSHYSKSQIFVQKFNFDKALQFIREIKVVNN